MITAYRNTGSWSSGTITWNNKPSYTTSECSTQATNDAGTSWWRMYNLTVVKKWLNGTYSQYGWMIKDATESGTTQWTTFYACDAPSPNKPELHIEYTESDPPVFRPPAYTYHDSGCIGDASDPINILFGGFVGDGYFGTLQGVIDGVTGSDGMWYEVTNYVPGIVPYQYVKFVPTSGSAVIRSNARSLGTGLLSDRYHMRLFLNPFACSCGYANKNTVTAAHHEDWTGSGHEIDQHWEQVEYYVCYRLHDLYQDNTWFDDIAYNGGYSVQGWSSNGYYSVMYLAP